jgi:hypothetical protein
VPYWWQERTHTTCTALIKTSVHMTLTRNTAYISHTRHEGGRRPRMKCSKGLSCNPTLCRVQVNGYKLAGVSMQSCMQQQLKTCAGCPTGQSAASAAGWAGPGAAKTSAAPCLPCAGGVAVLCLANNSAAPGGDCLVRCGMWQSGSMHAGQREE